MSQKHFMVGTTLAGLLLVISTTASFAQVPGLRASEYAKAVFAVIQQQWERDSYSNELEPNSSCAVRVVQIAGGDVVSVDILPECDFNEAGRAAIVQAVQRSGPLPYHGFEAVYRREIRIDFHAPSVSDRRAWMAAQAASAQVNKDAAESNKQWEARVGLPILRAEYVKQCSFHLLWEMPRIKLEHPTAVVVTVDKSGKVKRVAGVGEEPIDEKLAAALIATSPCGCVPVDLIVGAGTINIGPINVRSRSD